MSTATIAGGSGTGTVQTITYTSTGAGAAAQAALGNISNLLSAGYGDVNLNTGTIPNSVVIGSLGGATDADYGTLTALNLPNNVVSLTINNTGTTIASNSAFIGNASVLSGTGNLTFTDNGGATAIFTGGGTNNITFSANSANSSFTGDGTNTLTVNTTRGTTSVFGTSASADTIIGGTASVSGGIAYTSSAGSHVFINPQASNVTVFGAAGGGSETVFGGTTTNNFTGRLTVTDGTGYFQGGAAGGNNMGSSAVGSTTLIGGGSGDVLTARGVGDVLVAASGAATLDGSNSAGGVSMFAASTGASLQFGSKSVSDTFYTNTSTTPGVGFTGSFVDMHSSPNSVLHGLNSNVSDTLAVGFSANKANFATVGDFISGLDKVVLNTAVTGSTYTLSSGTLPITAGGITYTNLVTSNGSQITFYNAVVTAADITKV